MYVKKHSEKKKNITRVTTTIALLLSAICNTGTASAQELLKNGTFNSTTANWVTACNSVEAVYYETTYGGTVSTNHVAEVDDESCFYQNVCVLPGMTYAFNMKASRRSTSGTPNPVTTHIKIEGLDASNAVVGSPYVNMDFTRSNTTFSLTPVTGIPTFSVPISAGVVRLKITLTDNSAGYATLGMIVDDLSLTFTSSPALTGADTACQNTSKTFSIPGLPASGIYYTWSFGANATPATSTAASPSVYWSTTGAQQVSCILSNGSCAVDTVLKTVQVTTNPQAPFVISPVKYCTGATAAPLTATGTNLQWYATATGGTPLGAAPTPSTATAGTTIYYVSAKSGSCESNCTPLSVEVYNNATAGFNYTVKYGCSQDTVIFSNQSAGGGNYQWDFGDGNGTIVQNTTHIYTTQAVYKVTLKNAGNYCRDSVSQSIDLVHPLHTDFIVDVDTICQYQTVTFTDKSITTTKNNTVPTYSWDFGDGATSSAANPTHTYTRAGVFVAKLTITDFVPCTDVASHIIYADTVPDIHLTIDRDTLCAGDKVTLETGYQPIGNTGIRWDFGDGNLRSGLDKVTHAFDISGNFTIKVTASYRICPDTSARASVFVKPFPVVNIGPDTSMCPNAAPIALKDDRYAGNPGAHWLWNTGEQTPGILVSQPGHYALAVDLNGCTAADSIDIVKDCYINIPNTFTPNEDGINDYFFPRQLLSASLSAFKMQIFNRWGQIIFETANIDGRGWDGRFNNAPQPQGAYIYLIDVLFKNGVKEHYTGNVTLLR